MSEDNDKEIYKVEFEVYRKDFDEGNMAVLQALFRWHAEKTYRTTGKEPDPIAQRGQAFYNLVVSEADEVLGSSEVNTIVSAVRKRIKKESAEQELTDLSQNTPPKPKF